MIPSVKTIAEFLTKGDVNKAKIIRRIMETPSAPTELTQMQRIDAVLGTHGVEYIPHGKNQKSPTIVYCNAGDPYTNTMLKIRGQFRVGCWGNIVERGNYD